MASKQARVNYLIFMRTEECLMQCELNELENNYQEWENQSINWNFSQQTREILVRELTQMAMQKRKTIEKIKAEIYDLESRIKRHENIIENMCTVDKN